MSEKLEGFIFKETPVDEDGNKIYECPDYTLKCPNCGQEEEVKAMSDDALDNAKCSACGAKMEVLYITYPMSGPGFEKDYRPQNLQGFGRTREEME